MNEDIVAAARSWIGTPYAHLGFTKRAPGVDGAVDCLMLLIGVFCVDTKRVPFFDPRKPVPYPRLWHVHRGEERYLNGLLQYCDPVLLGGPEPGDIATYRFGRCVSHAGIVTDADHMVHAYSDAGRVEETEMWAPALAKRFCGFMRLR